jgi:hypothetical protein
VTIFTAEEIAEVVSRYRRLRAAGNGVVEGVLDLHAEYDGEERRDAFEVRIVAPADYPDSMPSLTETAGRTAAVAAKYRIVDQSDLHRNPGAGTACLCVKQEEPVRFPRGANLSQFIEGLVVPYLFGLSHFDEHGKWPWPDRSHGALGTIEYYAECAGDPSADSINETLDLLKDDPVWRALRKQLRKPSAMRFCVCGSGKPISRCHKDVWGAVVKLNGDMRKLGLNLRAMLQR